MTNGNSFRYSRMLVLIKPSAKAILFPWVLLSATSVLLATGACRACNVGLFNLGYGNLGFFNVGYRNAGLGNVGHHNIGLFNLLAVKTIGANNLLTREKISFQNIGVHYGKGKK